MDCLNCGSALHGPFCSQCGQKHEPHPHTLRHFLAELVETLSHADSRLWRTLRALILQPGALSSKFFAGKREYFLPPLRLYLVVSVLSFLAAGVGPSDPGSSAPAGPQTTLTVGTTPIDLPCDSLRMQGPLASTMQHRFVLACEEASRDGGKAIAERLLRILPRSLFVLLPLVAAVMQLLWWRPRRLYVEHLVFLVHNHSALFLAFGAASLSMRVIPASLEGLPILTLALYATWYCWRALRTFYQQGRIPTACKLLLLGFAYCLIAALTVFGAGILAVLGA